MSGKEEKKETIQFMGKQRCLRLDLKWDADTRYGKDQLCSFGWLGRGVVVNACGGRMNGNER